MRASNISKYLGNTGFSGLEAAVKQADSASEARID